MLPSQSRKVYYDAKTKRKIILFAEEHGNRAAGRQFTVSEANIRRWRKNRAVIFSCRAGQKSFTGPRNGRHPEVEEILANYVRELRSTGKPVSRYIISLKAKTEAQEHNISDFKVSEGWCTRFMVQHGFSLRCRTSICQKLPSHF